MNCPFNYSCEMGYKLTLKANIASCNSKKNPIVLIEK